MTREVDARPAATYVDLLCFQQYHCLGSPFLVLVFGMVLPNHPKQKTTEQLELERERAVEAERFRADQLEEQRSVAQLENELLTEMVAAEQVACSIHVSEQLSRFSKVADKAMVSEVGPRNICLCPVNI